MATLNRIVTFGNQLRAQFSDGSSALAYPTGQGMWLVSGATVSSGGAGGGTIPAPVDDYPWPSGTINTLSPLDYDYRECVDFACWRIDRDAGCTSAPWKWVWSNLTPNGGDAIEWKPAWQSAGWTIKSSPVAGYTGWYGSKAGTLGHVNYVQAVNADGTIVVEEYNWGGTHNYGTRTVTPGNSDAPDSYLSPPH